MPRRLIVSLLIAGLLAAGIVAGTRSSGAPLWYLTCVELNDLIERHWVDRPEAVGIYQAVHGEHAETACQSDHRDDVRAIYYWAFIPIEQIAISDPRYNPVSPTTLTQSASGRWTRDHMNNDKLLLRQGKYLVTIHWWDNDENEWFGPQVSGYDDGWVAWNFELVSSNANDGVSHAQFEVHPWFADVWIGPYHENYNENWRAEIVRLSD